MASTCLLYISAARVTLYNWQTGRLSEEARFTHDEEGLEAFAGRLRASSDELFHIMVDVVEEDFFADVIPFVRGKDRNTLLDRRRAQRYRDASLSMTASLGYERTQRREERVLLSAFTNVEFLEPWLALLLENKVAISGIYSPGLLVPAMAHALSLPKARLIMVSVHEAGLRQTYVENGKLRFSRLSPLNAEDIGNRERLDIALGTETGRMYQYLRATNVLGIDHPLLDVVVIAPPGEAELAKRYIPELPQLKVEVLDQQQIALRIGLVSQSTNVSAESLFLHLLAQRRPGTQYAPMAVRKQYRGHQARLGIVLGGALVGAACVVATGLTLWQSYGLKQQIAQDRMQIDATNAQYQQVEAGFPELPTTRDKLRAAMDQYALILKLPSGPERFALELSSVLDASPRVELQKLRWHIGATPTAASATGSSAPAKTDGDRFEVLEIEASLNGVPAADYRAANGLAESFISELGKIPQVEIVETKLPFETGSQQSLSAQIGQTQTDSPRFSVVLARRLGS